MKSIRNGKAQLADAFARIDKGEVWLYGAYIEEYSYASLSQHAPRRPRKLLLHAREIDKLPPNVPVWIYHIKPQFYDEIAEELSRIDPARISLLEQDKIYSL